MKEAFGTRSEETQPLSGSTVKTNEFSRVSHPRGIGGLEKIRVNVD
jgi:hypothetical protein